MTILFQRAGALALAGAALLAAPSARADIFAFDWGYRWASGQILHDTGVADSDPSALRDVYTNAILGFDMSGLRPADFTFPALRGAGGTIVVDKAAPGSGGVDTITFLFGAAMPGDVESYRLVASFDPEFQFLPHALDQAWSAGLAGGVLRGVDEDFFVAMSPAYETRHTWVAAPVPEPGAGALFAAGLAGLAAAARRRRIG